MVESGELGAKNNVSLQNTVYYYNCKIFGIVGLEHKVLTTDQFKVGEDHLGKYVHYVGKQSNEICISKQHKFLQKNIKHYSSNPGTERCIADLYKVYLQAVGKGEFYKRPRSSAYTSNHYAQQPVGVNTLHAILKSMCCRAGLIGNTL